MLLGCTEWTGSSGASRCASTAESAAGEAGVDVEYVQGLCNQGSDHLLHIELFQTAISTTRPAGFNNRWNSFVCNKHVQERKFAGMIPLQCFFAF